MPLPNSISFKPRIIWLGHVQSRDRKSIQRPHFQRQAKQTDESFRVALVIDIFLAKGGKILAVQTEWGGATGRDNVAFVQFESHFAGDWPLGGIDESIDRFAQRRKPESVVRQFCI